METITDLILSNIYVSLRFLQTLLIITLQIGNKYIVRFKKILDLCGIFYIIFRYGLN